MQRVNTLNIPLTGEQDERLQQLAQRHNAKDIVVTALRLIEEGMRLDEFPWIVFRDTPYGRQAFVEGTGLTVWEAIATLRAYKENTEAAAEALGWPPFKMAAAQNYARAYANEINCALKDNDSITFTDLQQIVPGMEIFRVSDEALDRIVPDAAQ